MWRCAKQRILKPASDCLHEVRNTLGSCSRREVNLDLKVRYLDPRSNLVNDGLPSIRIKVMPVRTVKSSFLHLVIGRFVNRIKFTSNCLPKNISPNFLSHIPYTNARPASASPCLPSALFSNAILRPLTRIHIPQIHKLLPVSTVALNTFIIYFDVSTKLRSPIRTTLRIRRKNPQPHRHTSAHFICLSNGIRLERRGEGAETKYRPADV